MKRVFLATVCLVLALPACSGYARSGRAQPSSAPVEYGSDLDEVTNPDVGKPLGNGVLSLQVTDTRKRPLAGAIVRWVGPAKGQKATDARGRIKVSVKPGTYELDLAPCGTTIVTTAQQTAQVTVAGGRETPLGILPNISWKRRFTPTNSVRTSVRPPWKIGDTVRVSIRIEDGCNFKEARNAPLDPYAWKVGSNFAIARAPVMKAGSDGYAPLEVRCTAPGNGSILLYDRSDRDNSVDAITAGTGPGAGRTWCE